MPSTKRLPTVVGTAVVGIGAVVATGVFGLTAGRGSSPPLENVALVSHLGGKCLDLANGNTADGTPIVAWACTGSWNQLFWLNPDGSLTVGGKCVEAPPADTPDAAVVVRACSGQPAQKWRLEEDRLIAEGDRCLDLEGGAVRWPEQQRIILRSCHGGENQLWHPGAVTIASHVRGAATLKAGQRGGIQPVASERIEAAGGLTKIAAGGGSTIDADGGTVIVGGADTVIVVAESRP